MPKPSHRSPDHKGVRIASSIQTQPIDSSASSLASLINTAQLSDRSRRTHTVRLRERNYMLRSCLYAREYHSHGVSASARPAAPRHAPRSTLITVRRSCRCPFVPQSLQPQLNTMACLQRVALCIVAASLLSSSEREGRGAAAVKGLQRRPTQARLKERRGSPVRSGRSRCCRAPAGNRSSIRGPARRPSCAALLAQRGAGQRVATAGRSQARGAPARARLSSQPRARAPHRLTTAPPPPLPRAPATP